MTVAKSFAEPVNRLANHDNINRALKGEKGVIETTNYNGDAVLSAFEGIDLHGNRWALIAEQHQSEAFILVSNLATIFTISLIIATGLIAFLAIRFAASIAMPIKKNYQIFY